MSILQRLLDLIRLIRIVPQVMEQILTVTAMWATGALIGFAWAGKRLAAGSNAYRLAGAGILACT